MKKKIHFYGKPTWKPAIVACGIRVDGDQQTNNHKKITCGNCKRAMGIKSKGKKVYLGYGKWITR